MIPNTIEETMRKRLTRDPNFHFLCKENRQIRKMENLKRQHCQAQSWMQRASQLSVRLQKDRRLSERYECFLQWTICQTKFCCLYSLIRNGTIVGNNLLWLIKNIVSAFCNLNLAATAWFASNCLTVWIFYSISTHDNSINFLTKIGQHLQTLTKILIIFSFVVLKHCRQTLINALSNVILHISIALDQLLRTHKEDRRFCSPHDHVWQISNRKNVDCLIYRTKVSFEFWVSISNNGIIFSQSSNSYLYKIGKFDQNDFRQNPTTIANEQNIPQNGCSQLKKLWN